MHGRQSSNPPSDSVLSPLLFPGGDDAQESLELDHDDIMEQKALEATLVRKLDQRMAILVLIYILNCALLHSQPSLNFPTS